MRCSPEERADLLQEGLISGLQAASSYDSSKGASIATWILRRVVGQIRDVSQRLRNHGVTHRPPGVFAIADSLQLNIGQSEDGEDSDDYDIELVDTALPLDEQALIADSMDRLGAALPESDCTLLRLYYAEDMSTREIGNRLDVSHASIAVRLQRALERAKRVLLAPQKANTILH